MRVQVEFVHFSLAGSAKDAVAVQIGGLENAPCGVATVLGECVLVEGLLSQVEGYQSASLGTDIECSVIFDGRPQDTDVVIQDCAGIVKVEQVAVRVIVVGPTGIGSDPDSLHPVEQDAVESGSEPGSAFRKSCRNGEE